MRATLTYGENVDFMTASCMLLVFDILSNWQIFSLKECLCYFDCKSGNILSENKLP